MQKSTEEELNLFAFLLPFEIMVWLSTIAVVSIATPLSNQLQLEQPATFTSLIRPALGSLGHASVAWQREELMVD